MMNCRYAVLAAAIASIFTVPIVFGASAAQAGDLQTAAAPSSDASAVGNELNQLRANQQLLQRRLDQLEQIAQVGPAHPRLPPGTASLAGSFPRSFLIPGTDTSISIGGHVTLDVGFWFAGGNPNVGNGVVPSVNGIAFLSGAALSSGPGANPAARSRGREVLQYSVYNSRLHFETRTPTAFGEATTVVEFDFLGCAAASNTNCSNLLGTTDSLLPRLRLAYGTLGPWMLGQNWAVGFDLQAAPETFDTGGFPGAWGPARVPEIVYTTPLAYPGSTLQVGLISPEVSAGGPWGGTLAHDTSAVGASALPGLNGETAALEVNPLHASAPDLAAALTFHQPWGHLQVKGVINPQRVNDGINLDQWFLGYGGGISGSFKPLWMSWSKDHVGFNALIGNGLGRWAEGGGGGSFFPALATNYGAVPFSALALATGNVCGYGHVGGATTAACAAGVRTRTIPEWGAEINYQHWWSPVLRSTIDFGVINQDVPSGLVGSFAVGGHAFNQQLMLGHANLIWSPVPFVNTGLEFVYGHRRTNQGGQGDQAMLDYEFMMKF